MLVQLQEIQLLEFLFREYVAESFKNQISMVLVDPSQILFTKNIYETDDEILFVLVAWMLRNKEIALDIIYLVFLCGPVLVIIHKFLFLT